VGTAEEGCIALISIYLRKPLQRGEVDLERTNQNLNAGNHNVFPHPEQN